MKNIFLIILLFILSVSCKKLPINGDFDGMWQLMSIEKSTGEIVETKEDRIYYSVQLHLLSLRQAGGTEHLSRFIKTEDSLKLYDIRRAYQNSIPATQDELEIYGLSSENENFSIEELTEKRMILQSHYSILTFRKF